MKYYYFFTLFLGFAATAQIVNIPDTVFKNRLLESSSTEYIAKNLAGVYFKIDTNNDGQIQVAEAAQVSYINVQGIGATDLTGILSFVNLQTLNCAVNQITFLDLHGLTQMTGLSCSNNQLTSLNVDGLVNVTSMNCSYNQLTSLDVSSLVALHEFSCGENLLTTLDVNNQHDMTTLSCWNNQLVTLFVKNGKYESSIGYTGNPTLQYVCADESQVANFVSNNISLGYTNCYVGTYCTFAPGATHYTIQGNVKFDSGNDGCGALDGVIPNFKLAVTNGSQTGMTIPDASGNYSIPAIAGAVTVTPVLENPEFFSVSPAEVVVNFPTQGSPFVQDFCVTANASYNDLEVSIIPLDAARPGFDAHYKLIYKNKGTMPLSGSVTFAFEDDKVDFIAAVPAADAQQPGLLIWNYTTLLPFGQREILVTLNLNSPVETPALNNGDQLNFSAVASPVTNDAVVADNYASMKQFVVGSFDPNDKTCVEGNTVAPEIAGSYVHYVIRFENTGTYAAENIVVADIIDATKFEINSLIPIDGSHSFYTRIKGNKVEFIFENIDLPFDDAGNDGYVAFKIKTKNTLVAGDSFSNKANIFFDYNAPIETNLAITTLQLLSAGEIAQPELIALYPNPVQDSVQLQYSPNVAVNSVQIFNTLGRLVQVIIGDCNGIIDVSHLASGDYFVKISTDSGVCIKRFIKR
jgi:uncharacterized repeat protein (TIGR01451 family)